MANEVLLQAWLQMASVTEIWPIKYISLRLSRGICHACFPYPRSRDMFVHIVAPSNATCGVVSGPPRPAVTQRWKDSPKRRYKSNRRRGTSGA